MKASFDFDVDNFVYRRSQTSMDLDYPRPIRDVFGRWEGGIWQTLPEQIDTALTWPNQEIFFFKVSSHFCMNLHLMFIFSRANIIGRVFDFNYNLVIHV